MQHSDDHGEQQPQELEKSITAEEVTGRIEDLVASIVEGLDEDSLPQMKFEKLSKRFTLTGSRNFTSILMVLSYCHCLLQEHRSTTTREVYYFFVTHFRHQRECEQAIWDTAQLLGVSRISLGLTASPKGMYCCTHDTSMHVVCKSHSHDINTVRQ